MAERQKGRVPEKGKHENTSKVVAAAKSTNEHIYQGLEIHNLYQDVEYASLNNYEDDSSTVSVKEFRDQDNFITQQKVIDKDYVIKIQCSKRVAAAICVTGMAAILLLAIVVAALSFAILNKFTFNDYKTEASDMSTVMMKQLTDINETLSDMNKVQNAHASDMEHLEKLTSDNAAFAARVDSRVSSISGYTLLANCSPSRYKKTSIITSTRPVSISVSTTYNVSYFELKF